RIFMMPRAKIRQQRGPGHPSPPGRGWLHNSAGGMLSNSAGERQPTQPGNANNSAGERLNNSAGERLRCEFASTAALTPSSGETNPAGADSLAVWSDIVTGGASMAVYVLRRLGLAVITLLLLSIIVFFAGQVLPGDPGRAILGNLATPGAVRILDHQLGVDRPLLTQYWSWITGLLHG